MNASTSVLSISLFMFLLLPRETKTQDWVVGEIAYRYGNFATALQRWEPLANFGDPRSQYGMGLILWRGRGVPKDVSKAKVWFEKAASKKHPAAHTAIGNLFIRGEGVPMDRRKAYEWYRRAALLGDPSGQFNLGMRYMRGEFVSKDEAEGARWIKLSAEQGGAYQQGILGAFYRLGRGVPTDKVRAYKWFMISATRGNLQSIADIQSIKHEMTQKEISAAQKLAEEWVKRFSERIR